MARTNNDGLREGGGESEVLMVSLQALMVLICDQIRWQARPRFSAEQISNQTEDKCYTKEYSNIR